MSLHIRTAFDQIDDIPCFASGSSTYVEGLVRGCAPIVGTCPPVVAGEADTVD